jgi:hypothetical protein
VENKQRSIYSMPKNPCKIKVSRQKTTVQKNRVLSRYKIIGMKRAGVMDLKQVDNLKTPKIHEVDYPLH